MQNTIPGSALHACWKPDLFWTYKLTSPALPSLTFFGSVGGGMGDCCGDVQNKMLCLFYSYSYYYFRSVQLVHPFHSSSWCHELDTRHFSRWICRIQWHYDEDVLFLSLPLLCSWCLLVLCDMRWFCLWLARLVHASTPLVVTLPSWCPIVDVLFHKW